MVKTSWPWISLLLAAIVALNPVGLDFLRSAFLASEALTRNIAQPIVLAAAAILVLAGVTEWLVRAFIVKRRARGGTSRRADALTQWLATAATGPGLCRDLTTASEPAKAVFTASWV